jgi:hypothetical protein
MLDGTLDPLIANYDLEGLALDGFTGIRQGARDMTE